VAWQRDALIVHRIGISTKWPCQVDRRTGLDSLRYAQHDGRGWSRELKPILLRQAELICTFWHDLCYTPQLP